LEPQKILETGKERLSTKIVREQVGGEGAGEVIAEGAAAK
jgi:hypothetical protein